MGIAYAALYGCFLVLRVMRFGNGISARLPRQTHTRADDNVTFFTCFFIPFLFFVKRGSVISFLHFFDFVTQLSCMLEVLLFDCFFQFRTFLFNRRGFFYNGNLTCRFPQSAQRVACGYFALVLCCTVDAVGSSIGIRRSRNTL